MATERTLILVKPDAFARGLSGEIIARFERKGLTIVAAKHMTVTEDLAKQHYAEHAERPFFGELVEFITSGPIVALVFEGESAIRAARQVIGATNPLESTTGSIRGDFAISVGQNMVHGSDSPESGQREASLFFGEASRQDIPSAPPRSSGLNRSLILASASPQRRAILTQVGIPFEVIVSGVDEETHGDPAWVAEENARRKALAVPGAFVLGADTLVAIDGDILGKPADAAQAREYVGRLAGRTHHVVGAIAIVENGELAHTAVEVTKVRFREASPEVVDWYVTTGEWKGRAGGYAIQGAGAALVGGIEGDYLNVVGLPLARLLDLAPGLLPTG